MATNAFLPALLLFFCAGMVEHTVAFQPTTVPIAVRSSFRLLERATTRLHVGGMGWDNENFLESLGKGQDAIEKANAEYERIKRNVVPASDGGLYDDELSSLAGAGSKDPDALPGDDGITSGATLSADRIERIKRQNEEESAGGGEMFKKLLERAQQGGGQRPPPPPPVSIAPPVPAAPMASNTSRCISTRH